jgi:hypothetical protein
MREMLEKRAGFDLRLAVRLRASSPMPDDHPFGIALEPSLQMTSLLSPASAPAAVRAVLRFHPRAIFFHAVSN